MQSLIEPAEACASNFETNERHPRAASIGPEYRR